MEAPTTRVSDIDMQVGPSQNESTSRRRSGLCKRGNWSRVIGRRRAFPNARSAVVVSLRSPRFHHDSTRLASWLHLAIPAAQRATNPSIGKEPRHTPVIQCSGTAEAMFWKRLHVGEGMEYEGLSLPPKTVLLRRPLSIV